MPTEKDVILKGIELHKSRNYEAALRLYDAVIGRKVFDPYLCHALGTLFIDMGFYGVAVQLLTRCVETSPEDAPWMSEAYLNLGVALRKESHEMEAAACYRRSLEHNPTSPDAWANYAGVFVNYGDPEKCIKLAEKALSIDPNHAQAGHHKALGLLELGKYEAGFRQYESRLRIPEFHDRKYPGERWYGKKVKGTLVVHGEQGLGDEVMFCSLIPRVKKLCDNLIIECNHKLVPLFERSFGVKCYGDGEEIKQKEKVDHWCPMGSLPFVLGIKSPITHDGFLKTNPELDEKYKREGFRVGLSWRGGMKMTHEHLRNFSLKVWKDFVKPEWVSLQYGREDWSDVLDHVKELGIQDTGWRGDMDEFASLVKSCDFIVTVCNTTVHFAGALNVPAFVLVPSKPAWRYGLAGERMLWYPSVKMIRQKDGEEWADVLKRIKAEIPDGISRQT